MPHCHRQNRARAAAVAPPGMHVAMPVSAELGSYTRAAAPHCPTLTAIHRCCCNFSHLKEYSALRSSSSLASATSEAQQDSSNLHRVAGARSCPTYSRYPSSYLRRDCIRER